MRVGDLLVFTHSETFYNRYMTIDVKKGTLALVVEVTNEYGATIVIPTTCQMFWISAASRIKVIS